MSNIELILNYEGAVSSPENIKKDFRKAMRIIGLSLLSAAILSVGLFLIAFFLQ